MRAAAALLVVLFAACDRSSPSTAAATPTAAPSPPPPPTPPAGPTVRATAVDGYQVVTDGPRTELRAPGFAVDFPGLPEVTEVPATSPRGATHMAMHTDATLAFAVFVSTLTDALEPDLAYARARDGALRAVGATLVEESPASLDGVPGRRITIAQGDAHVVMHVALVPARHELVSVVATFAARDVGARARADGHVQSLRWTTGPAQ